MTSNQRSKGLTISGEVSYRVVWSRKAIDVLGATPSASGKFIELGAPWRSIWLFRGPWLSGTFRIVC